MKKYPVLKYQKLSEDAFDPKREKGSSGIDVFSPHDYLVPSRGDVLIPLDIRFEIPEGYDISVYNKSGVATKRKMIFGANLIDQPYRGNCHAHLFNMTDTDITINRGDKIVQLVMREVWLGDMVEVENISTATVRGEKAFGSSGTTA